MVPVWRLFVRKFIQFKIVINFAPIKISKPPAGHHPLPGYMAETWPDTCLNLPDPGQEGRRARRNMPCPRLFVTKLVCALKRAGSLPGLGFRERSGEIGGSNLV